MTQDQATPGATPPEPGADEARTPDGAADPLAGLEGLDDVPVGEHVERFTRVHDALRARLDGSPDDGSAEGRTAAGPGR